MRDRAFDLLVIDRCFDHLRDVDAAKEETVRVLAASRAPTLQMGHGVSFATASEIGRRNRDSWAA